MWRVGEKGNRALGKCLEGVGTFGMLGPGWWVLLDHWMVRLLDGLINAMNEDGWVMVVIQRKGAGDDGW